MNIINDRGSNAILATKRLLLRRFTSVNLMRRLGFRIERGNSSHQTVGILESVEQQ